MIPEWVFQLNENDQSRININGKGQKKLWVVCGENDLDSDNEVQLRAIIQAIKYDLDTDCKLVTINNKVILSDIMNGEALHLLVFGIPPEYLGYNIEYSWYLPMRFESFIAIFSESLDALSKDKSKKGKLWVSLKNIFLES